jgi:anti-anti-sigma factor
MTYHDANGVTVLTPQGCLHEGEESDRLEASLGRLLDRERPVIAVDLSRAGHLSARAIGIVADAHAKALARGGRLVVCGVRADHQRLFDLTGLSEVLDLRKDRASKLPRAGILGRAVA